jgi:hypothetical protein
MFHPTKKKNDLHKVKQQTTIMKSGLGGRQEMDNNVHQ